MFKKLRYRLVIFLRMDDQVLEVIGLFSSVHVGKIQVSIAEPLRIGQASSIKVRSCMSVCVCFWLKVARTCLCYPGSLGCVGRERAPSRGWGTLATRTIDHHYHSQVSSPHASANSLIPFSLFFILLSLSLFSFSLILSLSVRIHYLSRTVRVQIWGRCYIILKCSSIFFTSFFNAWLYLINLN